MELSSDLARRSAVQDLVRDFYAPSSARSMDHKWTTIRRALSMWGLEPLPPTSAAIVALGAALKKGNYQSADSYLSLYRVRAEREGYPLDAAMARLIKDTVRSCNRGRGAPVRPMGLPFERLGDLLQVGEAAWSAEGPLGPGRAVLLGSWFMMREQELSTTRASLVTLREGQGGSASTISWSLPASKNDSEAAGVTRSHGCCCSASRSWLCPFHAVVDQLEMLKVRFPGQFRHGVPEADLPLFPTAEGGVVTKSGMTETIVAAADLLKVEKQTADGSERVSGHSLRVTGAQGLSRAGLDVWAIQLLGRWGSDAVLTYVRSVPLQKSAEWAKKVMANTLEHKLKEKGVEEHVAVASAHTSSCVGKMELNLSKELKEAREADAVQLMPHAASKFVRSARGAFHKVGLVDGRTATWSSACGWRFLPSEASVFVSDLPRDVHYKFLCAKCLGAERLARKAVLEGI